MTNSPQISLQCLGVQKAALQWWWVLQESRELQALCQAEADTQQQPLAPLLADEKGDGS